MSAAEATARAEGLSRPAVAAALIELVATAFLLIAVVGSGIMAERLVRRKYRRWRCSPTRSRPAARWWR